jgi:hypothetical protein
VIQNGIFTMWTIYIFASPEVVGFHLCYKLSFSSTDSLLMFYFTLARSKLEDASVA